MIAEEKLNLIDGDDFFVLGNIALSAVQQGYGNSVLPILEILKKADPENASAPLVHAMYLDSIGKHSDALEVLEDADIFNAKRCMDDAVAYHLLLLHKMGENERALRLATVYLNEKLINTTSAVNMIETVKNDAEYALLNPDHAQ